MKAGIAGAGLMGRLLAYRLVNAGWSVTLFDKDVAVGEANCAFAAAGMLTPLSELEKNPAIIFQLGMESLQTGWLEIVQALNPAIYFQQQGSLVVSHPRDQAELQRFIGRVADKFKSSAEKAECKDRWRPVNRQQITALEPQLTQFDQAVFFSDEAHLDNQAVMRALGNYLQKTVDWRGNTLVTAVKPRKIQMGDKEEYFDCVFDCRGLGAKSSFADLRGVRGELIWVHAPEVKMSRLVRLLNPRYSLYIVPRADDVYILGASEIESEDRSSISVRSTLELLSAAYYVNPAFAEARIIKTVVDCRPTLVDHLPKIKYTDGLFAINGLYRHGFLIAPALVAEILRGLDAKKRYPTLWEKFHDQHLFE